MATVKPIAKPDVKAISSMSALPALPEGQKYSFKPASTIDQARGVCIREGATQGYWLKNRVYYVSAKACLQIKPICTCLEFIGDNPNCQAHGSKAVSSNQAVPA